MRSVLTFINIITGLFRGVGVAYPCHLSDGKNTCAEKDVEVTPSERIVTIFFSDTKGLTKLLSDYMVESTLKKMNDQSTIVEISHFYPISKWKPWILNLIIRRKTMGNYGYIICNEKDYRK